MKYYPYAMRDCGDGSSTLEFFETDALIELVEQLDPESYGSESCGEFMVDGHILNIEIITLADIKKQYGEDVVEKALNPSEPEPEVAEETPEPKPTRKTK